MRIELPQGEDTILFDRELVAEALAAEVVPADTLRRDSAFRDRAIRQGHAVHVSRHLTAPLLLIDEPLPEHTRWPDRGPTRASIQLPSGTLTGTTLIDTGVPPETLARVEPGTWRVAFVVEENIPAPGPHPDRIPDPIDRLSPAEQKAIRRHEDAVMKIGVGAAALALGAGGWQAQTHVILGLLLGLGIALLGGLFMWSVSHGPGVHPLIGEVREARKKQRRLIAAARTARDGWRAAGGRKIRDIVLLRRHGETGKR